MSTHTPTPWIQHGQRIDDIAGKCIAAVDRYDHEFDGEANAALIVQAVNSHAALVDLVRRAYDRFTDNDMQPANHALSVWLEQAHAALALAGKA